MQPETCCYVDNYLIEKINSLLFNLINCTASSKKLQSGFWEWGYKNSTILNALFECCLNTYLCICKCSHIKVSFVCKIKQERIRTGN